MTDYDKATGSSATMKIRDTGSVVEFWINSNNSTTWTGALPWGWTINGSTGSSTYNYQPGVGWKRLGAWTVTTDQTVTFRLGATGTAGFGGPTTFSVAIDRTGPPPMPGTWQAVQIWDTQVRGDVNSLPNGGLALDQIQVRYDDDGAAASPSYFDPGLDGDGIITGLARGKTYYFWVRTHNAKGWSPWSSRSQMTTHDYPPAPTKPVISNVTQNSLTAKFSSNGTGGPPSNLEYQLAFDTLNPLVNAVTSTGTNNLTNLVAGARYLFRARARNVYGWGPWSSTAEATLLAGAYVDWVVDPATGATVKKRAVPYVKYNGVWKVVQPIVNIKGLWKPTQ